MPLSPSRGYSLASSLGANSGTFVDIGTAQGASRPRSRRPCAHPRRRVHLPSVRTSFERYVAEHGLAGRLSFYSGDFLTDQLPQADVLIMGRVLHNWDLPTKQALLHKAHSALPSGGALLVYERLVDNSRSNAAGLLSSLNMLVMTPGGFDFTGAECVGWMQEFGFRDMRVEKLTSDHSLVVGYRALVDFRLGPSGRARAEHVVGNPVLGQSG